MRMVLLELPSCGTAVARKAPPSFTRKVAAGMSKAEMILKVVMAPHDPANLFVEDYLKLVGEDDGLAGFQKILDMKGLKKSEQAPLVEAYVTLQIHLTPLSLSKSLSMEEYAPTPSFSKIFSAEEYATFSPQPHVI